MANLIKIIPIHNPKGEEFNVQLINQLLNDELEIDGTKPNEYKSMPREIFIVTGQKTLKEVYTPAYNKKTFQSRNHNITMTIERGEVFILKRSDTKPEEIPGFNPNINIETAPCA